MASIRERFDKWKARKWYQIAGDIFFWVLLIMLVIPGPRKIVATNMNKVMLHLRRPSIAKDANTYQLTAAEYNWNLTNDAGMPVPPETLQGEVIFLNFWGTYCPPCIAEMPEIQKIYDDYKDKVKFILVSAESPQKVQNFLDSRGYDLPSYFAGSSMPDALSVRSIPTTFIISRDGRIVSKKIGAADWDSKATRRVFDELLGDA